MEAQPQPPPPSTVRTHSAPVSLPPSQHFLQQCQYVVSQLPPHNKAVIEVAMPKLLSESPNSHLWIGHNRNGALVTLERLWENGWREKIQFLPSSGNQELHSWQKVRSVRDLDNVPQSNALHRDGPQPNALLPNFPQRNVQNRPCVPSNHTPEPAILQRQLHQILRPGMDQMSMENITAPQYPSARPPAALHHSFMHVPVSSHHVVPPAPVQPPLLCQPLPLNHYSGASLPHNGPTARPLQMPVRSQQQLHLHSRPAQSYTVGASRQFNTAMPIGMFHSQSNWGSFPSNMQPSIALRGGSLPSWSSPTDQYPFTFGIAPQSNFPADIHAPMRTPIRQDAVPSVSMGIPSINIPAASMYPRNLGQIPGETLGYANLYDPTADFVKINFRPEDQFEQPTAMPRGPNFDHLNLMSEKLGKKRPCPQPEMSEPKRRAPLFTQPSTAVHQSPVDSPQVPHFPADPGANVHSKAQGNKKKPDSMDSGRKDSMGNPPGPQKAGAERPRDPQPRPQPQPQSARTAKSQNTNTPRSSSSKPLRKKEKGRQPGSRRVPPLPKVKLLDEESHKAALLTEGELNYYEVLRINADAGKEDIKKAFRKLSLVYHPDKNAGDEFATKRFQVLTHAHTALLDNTERAKYDATLMGTNLRPLQPKPTPTS